MSSRYDGSVMSEDLKPAVPGIVVLLRVWGPYRAWRSQAGAESVASGLILPTP